MEHDPVSYTHLVTLRAIGGAGGGGAGGAAAARQQAQAERSHQPVSYTHLDVYKRQDQIDVPPELDIK